MSNAFSPQSRTKKQSPMSWPRSSGQRNNVQRLLPTVRDKETMSNAFSPIVQNTETVSKRLLSHSPRQDIKCPTSSPHSPGQRNNVQRLLLTAPDKETMSNALSSTVKNKETSWLLLFSLLVGGYGKEEICPCVWKEIGPSDWYYTTPRCSCPISSECPTEWNDSDDMSVTFRWPDRLEYVLQMKFCDHIYQPNSPLCKEEPGNVAFTLSRHPPDIRANHLAHANCKCQPGVAAMMKSQWQEEGPDSSVTYHNFTCYQPRCSQTDFCRLDYFDGHIEHSCFCPQGSTCERTTDNSNKINRRGLEHVYDIYECKKSPYWG
ncbi:unnamed protein product [Owenia fusiformis]|uniref:Uncharacterized protein n=1 Tax=Owenia fusiformis TaxID=6347 RepID=A0A8J1XRN3_OWEFU|nr:unnamed protein product [Owenia fusiformis]